MEIFGQDSIPVQKPRAIAAIAKYGLILLAIAVVVRLVMFNPNLPGNKIDRIVIKGVSGIKELQVYDKLTSLKGNLLFGTRRQTVKHLLNEFDWVNDVKLSYSYPSKLTVRILPIEPTAYLVTDDQLFGVDFQGRFCKLDLISDDLLFISGKNLVKTGKDSSLTISNDLTFVLNELQYLSNSDNESCWLDNISEIHVLPNLEKMVITDNPMQVFHLGQRQIKEYIPIIAAINSSDNKLAHSAYYDLRYDGTVIEKSLKGTTLFEIEKVLAIAQRGG